MREDRESEDKPCTDNQDDRGQNEDVTLNHHRDQQHDHHDTRNKPRGEPPMRQPAVRAWLVSGRSRVCNRFAHPDGAIASSRKDRHEERGWMVTAATEPNMVARDSESSRVPQTLTELFHAIARVRVSGLGGLGRAGCDWSAAVARHPRELVAE